MIKYANSKNLTYLDIISLSTEMPLVLISEPVLDLNYTNLIPGDNAGSAYQYLCNDTTLSRLRGFGDHLIPSNMGGIP